VHRDAGDKSRHATAAYEAARVAALDFAGRAGDGDDEAIMCRNTTEAINHLAYRLRLEPDDVVVTIVVEHHANLLPGPGCAVAASSNADPTAPSGRVKVFDGLLSRLDTGAS
jgi:hypothetical protein